MKGHIREKRPGRWELLFDLPADPVTGQRRQRSRTVVGTRDQAEEELARIQAELSEAVWIDDGSMRVGPFVDMWLMARRTQLRARTIPTYRQHLSYLTAAMGRRKLSQVTGGSLTALYGRLLERGLSPLTVLHVHRVTHRLFADAVRWGYLRSNPTAAADPPAARAREMTTWTSDQVIAFLDSCRDDRWLPVWELAAATAIREAELCGLRWDDFDRDRSTVHVQRTIKRVDRAWVVEPPKTARGDRWVALDEGTVAMLARWRRRQLEERVAAGPGWQGDDWVVTMSDGGAVNPSYLSKLFHVRVQRSGLPPIRFHDLRHTWATLAIAAGVPAKVVSERLGHAGVAITLDVYTHRVEQLDRDAAEAVAKLIRRG